MWPIIQRSSADGNTLSSMRGNPPQSFAGVSEVTHLFLILTRQNSIRLRGGLIRFGRGSQHFDIAPPSFRFRIHPICGQFQFSLSFHIAWNILRAPTRKGKPCQSLCKITRQPCACLCLWICILIYILFAPMCLMESDSLCYGLGPGRPILVPTAILPSPLITCPRAPKVARGVLCQ